MFELHTLSLVEQFKIFGWPFGAKIISCIIPRLASIVFAAYELSRSDEVI